MIKYLLALLVMFSTSVYAFDLSDLEKLASDPEKLQREAERMAKEAQQASECIDQASLQKLQQESQAMQSKIEELCSRGDRKGAEKAAIDYSRKLINSAEYRQIQQCTQQLRAMIPPDFMQEIQQQAEAANSTAGEVKHICDM